MSEFLLSGNQTSFRLPLTKTEYELINRFVWPQTDLPGKDMPLNSESRLRVTLINDDSPLGSPSITCELMWNNDVAITDVYDLTLAKWNELKRWVTTVLNPFWEKRSTWEQALENTMYALSLVERFEVNNDGK